MDFEKGEQEVPFLATEDDLSRFGSKRHNRGWDVARSTLLWILVVAVSNSITLLLASRSRISDFNRACVLHTTQSWSPVLDGVDIKYSTVRFNGTFFKDTIYREPPSPAVDQAWRDLGIEYDGILVPESQALKADIPLNRAMVNETYGGPGYPAVFEVFHQLHCLNLLRKGLYYNVDYYLEIGEGPFSHQGRQLRPHLGHCLDMIRQQLMCTADTGLQPFIWVGDPPHPFPDFSREHKCKNFDDILAFAKASQGDFEEARLNSPQDGELVLAKVP